MTRPSQSRDALLEAAERIFAEHGFAGARTEQIAAAAGVNKAMLHYYFESKEKLYSGVLGKLIRDFRHSVLDPLKEAPTASAALFGFIDRHNTFLATHPNAPRLVQRAMMTGGPHLRTMVNQFQFPVVKALRSILEDGIRHGEFRRVDIDHTVVSLAGITVFYFIVAPATSMVLKRDPYNPKIVEGRKQAVMDFVRYGLLADPRKAASLSLEGAAPKPEAAPRSSGRKKEGKP